MSESLKDLDLAKLFRQEQENFKNHLAVKDNEIMKLKALLARNPVHKETQTEVKQGKFDEILDKLDVNGLGKNGVQLKVINQVLAVDSDSVPYFESIQQFKDWISDLQKRLVNKSEDSFQNHQTNIQDSPQTATPHIDEKSELISTECQTDKLLAYSLLSLFAKELKKSGTNQKASTTHNLTEMADRYHNTLKYLNYQLQVNADIKKLLVDSVIGSQISKSYSFWGSDPDIQKNVLDLYNESLVQIGKLNFRIDTLESQNSQLNQILEDFLMATIN